MPTSQITSPLDMRRSWWTLAISTFAFTMCFAVWMMNGVLITFLVDNGVYRWSPSEMGWLIGIPVLTGSLFRLPLGIATDQWGGRIVFGLLLFLTAIPTWLVSECNAYWQFCLAGLGFGFVGTSFSIGIAYTSVWFPANRQGTALGIFGAGNAGAALTSLGAPQLLNWLTDHGERIEGWRMLPRLYALVLVLTAIVFFVTTRSRLPAGIGQKSLLQRLSPLGSARVWRFGLYYFYVFGGFVALAQWLVPYYVNAYAMSVAMAGALAACNSLPSGVIRALGGWMSDKWGARLVMYWVLGLSLVCCVLLIVPQMDIHAPGSGVMARVSGRVASVDEQSIVVVSPKTGEATYPIRQRKGALVSDTERNSGLFILPRAQFWHQSVVVLGQEVKKKELLARGVTHIFFQANVWVFTILSLILGAVMGVGKAAVYKHIPDYFPNDVGVVGGIVGVLGGLGGFVCPVIFGYLLQWTGLWTSCWMFFLALVVICLCWMHFVIARMLKTEALALRIE